MKISPAQVETARIALPQASTEAARSQETAEARATPESGDRVDLARGQSPAERVEHFASKVMDRLAMLAEKHGLDLSAVEDAFQKNIGRLQDGLAEGTIQGADIGKALANTLDILRDDVRAATVKDDDVAGDGREQGDTEVRERSVDNGVDLGGESRADMGVDLASESRVDNGVDLGGESRVDMGVDLASESRVDNGVDLGGESRVDMGVDLASESRVDNGVDLGSESRVDMGVDLASESRVDNGVDLDDGRADTRVDIAPVPPPGDSAARVEAYASTVVERMQALLAESEGPVAEGLVGALEQFGENVDRILAGLSGGSMSAEQVGQALQNTLQYAAQDVARALALGGDGEGEVEGTRLAPGTDEPGTDFGGRVDDGDGVGPAEARFDELTAEILERLGGLDSSGLTREGQAALAELTEEFQSATERLDQAFFEDGSIDRDQFLDLFASAYTELQEELGGLFGSEGPGVQLYDPMTGAEDLSAYPASRLDATA